MPQIMVSSYQENITISPRQRRLMGISSGLLLAVIEFVLGFVGIWHFHIDDFLVDPLLWLGYIALLYFIAPIPLSLYISRQTGNMAEGRKAGSMIGWTGALLTILSTGVYVGVAFGFGGEVTAFFVIFAFLNAFGALVGLIGAAIGSTLGNIIKV